MVATVPAPAATTDDNSESLWHIRHLHYVFIGLATFAVIAAACWLVVSLLLSRRIRAANGSAEQHMAKSIRANDMAAFLGFAAAIGTLAIALSSDWPPSASVIVASTSAALAVTSGTFWFVSNRYAAESVRAGIEQQQQQQQQQNGKQGGKGKSNFS